MPSNAQRGAYYKAKTRKWLEARGFQVAALEVVRWVGGAAGRFPVKHDQFGSDLLAMSGARLIFVQVKSGKACAGGTFPDARRKFAEFRFPSFTERRIIAWPPRSRSPRVVIV